MIWLTQWLCPQRHCSIAVAWDDRHATKEQIVEKGEARYRYGTINRWCFLCNSHDLNPEHQQTRFRSLEEAAPDLLFLQLQNMRTRDFLNPN